MANPPSNNDDFYSKALASLNHQMTLTNDNTDIATNATTAIDIDIQSYAKSLVEEDLPKIDSAIKIYLSLVAARSTVASDIDVLSDAISFITSVQQCTFASTAKTPMDANRSALMCARTLLSTINSTTIPPESNDTVEESRLVTIEEDTDETKNDEGGKTLKIKLQNNATQILWNKLVLQSQSNGTGDKAKQTKPSKVLGRQSLHVAYPYIQERLRRGLLLSGDNGNSNSDTASSTATVTLPKNNPLHALSNEVLPPVSPPKGIDVDQWKAFYMEFGSLLDRACSDNWCDENAPTQSDAAAASPSKAKHNDSALIWSNDKGLAELQSRRENRAQRATKALASVDGAKAVVTDALSSSTDSGGDVALGAGSVSVEHWRGDELVGRVTRS